ncbi:MAG: alpha/beta hydrolase [Oscillospiraceae bacterium]|jgi:acetyl esterase/lipase|nr:alpha/beta hydrolase [Oscillospiraceae bacterium]
MKIVQINNLRGAGGSLTGYLRDQTPEIPNRMKRPAILFCPGGGYQFYSQRESDPPALEFLAHGYHAFILDYSIRPPESGLPALEMKPLLQASAAVMEIRAHAEEWGVIPDQIAISGFSAGGHLAASLAVHWNSGRLTALQDTGSGLNRPNAAVLCYPVITAGEKAHRGSLIALGDGKPDWDAYFSLENHVSKETPPCFLWHTMDDSCVPVENSLLMASALHEAGVPTELHCYQNGAHGLALCRQETSYTNVPCATWLSHSMNWLDALFGFEP